MPAQQTPGIPISGMDCVECARHVKQAIAELPGVASVEVLVSFGKALIAAAHTLSGPNRAKRYAMEYAADNDVFRK